MKLSDILTGISVLRPYYDDPDGYHVGADHDVIYMYATDRLMSADDVARMRELGWKQLDDQDEDEPVYDHEESWSCYV